MGSAAIAKKRLAKLTWPEWSDRVEQLLGVGGFSMADFPQYSFRSWYLAGIPSGTVAVKILRQHVGWGEKKAVVGNE